MNWETKFWLLALSTYMILILGGAQIEERLLILNSKVSILEQDITTEKETQIYLQQALTHMVQIRKRRDIYPMLLWPMHVDDYKHMTSYVGLRDVPKEIYLGGSLTRVHTGIDMIGVKKARIVSIGYGKVVDHYLTPGWHNGKLYSGDPVFGARIDIEYKIWVYKYTPEIIHTGRVIEFKRIKYLTTILVTYGHMSETSVHIGDWVIPGQEIGKQGSTGFSTGPHLHVEVFNEKGDVLQPLNYMKDPNDA